MTILVVPPSYETATTETDILGFDFTNLMAEGDAVSSPAVVLVDLDAQPQTSTPVTGPQVNGNLVNVPFNGATYLQAGRKYRLEVTATLNTGKVKTMPLIILCEF